MKNTENEAENKQSFDSQSEQKSTFEKILEKITGNFFSIFSLLFSKILLFSEKSFLSFLNNIRKKLISDIQEIISILLIKNFFVICGFLFLFVGMILFLSKYISLDFVFLTIGAFVVLISIFINPKKEKK